MKKFVPIVGFILLIGIISLHRSANFYLDSKHFESVAVSTNGELYSKITHYSEHRVMHGFSVEFSTRGGKKMLARTALTDHERPGTPGDPVLVFYDPQNPQRIYIQTLSTLRNRAIVPGVTGALMTGVSFGCLALFALRGLRAYKNRYKSSWPVGKPAHTRTNDMIAKYNRSQARLRTHKSSPHGT